MQIHMTVTFFTLLSRLPYQISSLRACVRNTKFILNNYLCYCNSAGFWTEASCTIIQRRQICQVGQIVREGCNQCVCQDNGQFLCTNIYCPENALTAYGTQCTPFRSYYINCNLCTCPATGLSSEAHCTKDASCLLQSSLDFQMAKNNYCIPNVIYIFPCLHCLCSESGIFILDKCIEKCQASTKQISRCSAGSYYRNECDVCVCPENGFPDKKLCSNACNNETIQPEFQNLKEISITCSPFTFLKPKCMYCDCNFDGTVNESKCLELDCLNTSNYQNYSPKTSCSPGEVVPYCIECICPRDGLTNNSYCTNTCNYESKLRILERMVNENLVNIADITKIQKEDDEVYCDPNSIFVEDDKYCLCPENGYKSFQYCISSKEINKGLLVRTKDNLNNKLNSSKSCEPGTYIKFDCNVCYCSKDGKIDPKWCTYDDCVVKKTVQSAHKTRVLPVTNADSDGSCTPGSISKVKCNFCICPESGVLKERACTKNNCYEEDEDQGIGMDRFTCEPLAYYEVDCNICFCPRDGIKNVAKCTKNLCEKNFLRTNECVPGHLFTDVCNVCVCPPNGDRSDKACTEHNCGITTWKQIKLSPNLVHSKVRNVMTRTLDHCFPGEEFTVDCKICICPETGLKMYASCEEHTCDKRVNATTDIETKFPFIGAENDVSIVPHNRIRRSDHCTEYKISLPPERQECTPGSMYFVRCRQCICPYMGNINLFCRPLPSSVHCEQAFPGFNYLPMGRTRDEGTGASEETTTETIVLEVTHTHTKYRCKKIGKVMDRCFICNCEEDSNGLVVIEEHCFRSDAKNCTDSRPSFLLENKVVFMYVIVYMLISTLFVIIWYLLYMWTIETKLLDTV